MSLSLSRGQEEEKTDPPPARIGHSDLNLLRRLRSPSLLEVRRSRLPNRLPVRTHRTRVARGDARWARPDLPRRQSPRGDSAPCRKRSSEEDTRDIEQGAETGQQTESPATKKAKQISRSTTPLDRDHGWSHASDDTRKRAPKKTNEDRLPKPPRHIRYDAIVRPISSTYPNLSLSTRLVPHFVPGSCSTRLPSNGRDHSLQTLSPDTDKTDEPLDCYTVQIHIPTSPSRLDSPSHSFRISIEIEKTERKEKKVKPQFSLEFDISSVTTLTISPTPTSLSSLSFRLTRRTKIPPSSRAKKKEATEKNKSQSLSFVLFLLFCLRFSLRYTLECCFLFPLVHT